MGIKTYSPYTPSRRQMTGSDFSEITKSTPEKSLVVALGKKMPAVIIRVKLQLDIAEAVLRENTESSISREMQKTVFRQQYYQLNTIRTEQQTSL